jgi:serine/threonine protein kinase
LIKGNNFTVVFPRVWISDNQMDRHRLKQIEELYHDVAEMPAGHRQAFYKKHCTNDESLSDEVESLLSFEEIADSFIDNPPDAIAAEFFSDSRERAPLIGLTIGHYDIKSLLGQGGMGEVYLAQDNQLHRKVALKVLPAELIEHGDRLKRFKLEAQATSALNHPNILTTHEFGYENNSHYIVTEFVDGVTLRQKLHHVRLPVEETLDIAAQVAAALSAAHEAGIVHRDIKPENLMIRRDGIVKVLDFGIAKLTMPASTDTGGEAHTLHKTAPGTVVGTVGYMSPEQARGVRVDGRTDMWSLGVLIYEMATGHLPFEGPTQTDVLVAILNQPVLVFEDLVGCAPPELARIVDKCLAKDADKRYQSADQLASDLNALKHRLEFETELDRFQGDRSMSETRRLPVVGVPEAAPQPAGVRPDPKSSSANRNRLFVIGGLIALLVFAVVIAAVFGLLKSPSRSIEPTTPLSTDSAAVNSDPHRLTYSLTVQSFTDGRYKNPFTLSGEMLFRNRDRVRLNIKSPQAGQLYILNQGPNNDDGKAEFNILFPTPTTNHGSASLDADQEIQIPQQSWFELDNKEGTEVVWLVWAVKPIPELESAKKFANPEDRGRIKDSELNSAIESLLDRYRSNRSNVERDDDRKESRISGNTDIVTHTIKLEHH